jgi:hypothetical protein
MEKGEWKVGGKSKAKSFGAKAADVGFWIADRGLKTRDRISSNPKSAIQNPK